MSPVSSQVSGQRHVHQLGRIVARFKARLLPLNRGGDTTACASTRTRSARCRRVVARDPIGIGERARAREQTAVGAREWDRGTWSCRMLPRRRYSAEPGNPGVRLGYLRHASCPPQIASLPGISDLPHCIAAQTSGIWSGSLAIASASRRVHRLGASRDAVTATWTFPGKTPRRRRTLALRAHLARASRPPAQTISATPLA